MQKNLLSMNLCIAIRLTAGLSFVIIPTTIVTDAEEGHKGSTINKPVFIQTEIYKIIKQFYDLMYFWTFNFMHFDSSW